jgi:hypothetical protein
MFLLFTNLNLSAMPSEDLVGVLGACVGLRWWLLAASNPPPSDALPPGIHTNSSLLQHKQYTKQQ